MFAEKGCQGKLCANCSKFFPAKSLSIYTKKFSWHLFINLLKITFVIEENIIN